MRTVADLMITNLITLRENDSLAKAKALMQEKTLGTSPSSTTQENVSAC